MSFIRRAGGRLTNSNKTRHDPSSIVTGVSGMMLSTSSRCYVVISQKEESHEGATRYTCSKQDEQG